MTFNQPPKSVEDTIHRVLAEQLFAPTTSDYLTGDELAERTSATKQQLKPILNDHPEWIAWLATSEYEHPDEFSYYYELQNMLVDWIGEEKQGNDCLYKLALDGDNDWYVRCKAIRILGDKQAKDHLIQLLKPLMESHATESDFEETHETYFEVLAANHIQEALPYLRRIHKELLVLAAKADEFDDDFSREIGMTTIARAGLGDIEMLEPIIQLSYDDWYSTRTPAEAALKSLIKQIGEDNALQQLSPSQALFSNKAELYRDLSSQHDNGLVRNWALNHFIASKNANENQTITITHLIKALRDEQSHTRTTAIEQLITIGKPALPALTDTVSADSTPLTVKYCLLNIMANIGEDITQWSARVEDAYIPLPDFISPLMRSTIIKQWVGASQTGTDIRWLTEYLLTNQLDNQPSIEKNTGYQSEESIQQLTTDLKTKGFAVDEVVDYADEMQQGSSTYYLVKMAIDETITEIIEEDDDEPEKASTSLRDRLNISKLAPFVFYERHQHTEYGAVTEKELEEDDNEAHISSMSSAVDDEDNNIEKYLNIVSAHGFTWLSDEQLHYLIPGLNIYFFGAREPLSVRDLLFYWQD